MNDLTPSVVTPQPPPKGPLSPEESARLAELEPVIERGLANFIEVGKALLEISDRRLYRQTHSTFREYVEDKYNISVSRAYRMCEAAEVVKMLPIGQQSQITNERQARELAKAAPEERERVVAAVVETGKVTAGKISEVVSLGAPKNLMRLNYCTGQVEWYTPPEFIEAARNTMGSIDLDPASCETANKVVGATRFYTAEQDGLSREWRGNVWLNPPYAQPLVSKFAEKLTSEFWGGTVTQACVLVNNATDTVFFQRMLSAASAVCFPRGRITFLTEHGIPADSKPVQGQAIIYFGARRIDFANNFSQFGQVLWSHFFQEAA